MESVDTVLLNIIYLYLKILKIYLMFTLLNIILYYLKNIFLQQNLSQRTFQWDSLVSVPAEALPPKRKP